MTARILSTSALWTLIAATLYFGKLWGGLALLLVLTGAAHWELCTLLRRSGAPVRRETTVFLGTGILGFLAWGILKSPAAPPPNPILIAAPGLLIATLMMTLLRAPARLVQLFLRLPATLTWLYLPLSIAPLVYLAAEPWARAKDISGLLLVLWFVATVKFADCGALVTGLTLGRHKLAPSISPGKSWEGCVGGVIIAGGVAAAIAWLYNANATALGWTVSPEKFTPLKAFVLALPLAAIGIPSDLVESVFKRHAGVKDSGKTIPGIGGAYDLMDSLILTAPVGYLLIKFFVTR
jgi:phosphatidate cytidylyltransferase